MTTLRPLLRSNMQFTALMSGLNGRQLESKHPAPERVSAWECGVCGDLHQFEADAFECCAPQGVDFASDGLCGDSVPCPVCSQSAKDYHAAADCCLWHDIDAPTRWRIADLVEAGGTTWAEAIEKETSS